jgi:hypothetical protein
MGRENERISFRILPPAKVLSIFHKGPYDNIGDAYVFNSVRDICEQSSSKPEKQSKNNPDIDKRPGVRYFFCKPVRERSSNPAARHRELPIVERQYVRRM